MRDDHVRELLPLYVSGDLSPEDRRTVDRHLSSCRECAREYKIYVSLEHALKARRKQRSSPGRTYAMIERRLPLTPVFSPASILRSPAVIGTAAVTLVAILSILFRGQLEMGLGYFSRFSFYSLASSFETLPDWIVEATRSNTPLLALIIVAEMLLFSVAASLAVLRVIRH